MCWMKKRNRVELIKPDTPPFVAAYSERPFQEEKRSASYPDLLFSTYKKMYWCVRTGDIEVFWGLDGENGVDFRAHGRIVVSRKRVNPSSFEGKGFEYVNRDGIHYLYECELGMDGYFGYSVYLRDLFQNRLEEIARESSPEEFSEALKDFERDIAVREILNSNMLDFKCIYLT